MYLYLVILLVGHSVVVNAWGENEKMRFGTYGKTEKRHMGKMGWSWGINTLVVETAELLTRNLDRRLPLAADLVLARPSVDEQLTDLGV